MAAKTVAGKKTLQDLLISKGYATTNNALQYLQGKTVRIATACSYGKKGDKITIDATWYSNGGNTTNGGIYTNGNGNTLYFRYLEIPPQTVEELTNEIAENIKAMKELEKDNEFIKSKIEFMQVNSMDEYDEEVFKTYEVLKQLDNKKLTAIERAKVIAKIIKSS